MNFLAINQIEKFEDNFLFIAKAFLVFRSMSQ